MQNTKHAIDDLLKLKAPGTQNGSFDNNFTGMMKDIHLEFSICCGHFSARGHFTNID